MKKKAHVNQSQLKGDKTNVQIKMSDVCLWNLKRSTSESMPLHCFYTASSISLKTINQKSIFKDILLGKKKRLRYFFKNSLRRN